MFVNEMGWRRGRTAFASSDHLVSREGSYHATVNGTCRPFGLTGVHAADELRLHSDFGQTDKPQIKGHGQTQTTRHRYAARQPCAHTQRDRKSRLRSWPGPGRTRNGEAEIGAGKVGAKVGRMIRARAGTTTGEVRRGTAGRDKRLRWQWAGRLVMALLSLSPMTSGSRKARRGRKRKERRRKEATGGNPGSIAKKVAVTRIGSML